MSSSIERSEAAPGTRRAVALSLFAGLILLGLHQALAHWAALSPHPVLARLGPLAVPALLAIALAWRRGSLCGTLVATLVVGLLAGALRSASLAQWLALLPQVAVSLGIAGWFAGTLLPGREPLITYVARRVHGQLPAPIERYTRHITWAWTLWLTGLALVSVLLFAFASRAAWSTFANLLFFPLIALLFVGEYCYRILRYAWFKPASLADSIRAFQRHAGPRRSSGRTA